MTPTRGSLVGALVGLSLVAVSGCATVENLMDPEGPRWVGDPALAPPSSDAGRGYFRVASFNIEDGRAIDRAVYVIHSDPGLATADVLLLQEMDAEGTEAIARELGMGWIYYPSSTRNGRVFGNAILSRWPIEDDEKLVLPHRSIFGGRARTATVATVRFGDLPIRVYSVHLHTAINQFPGARVDQMLALLDDAEPYSHVVIGGDLNSRSLAERGVARGYRWPTRDGPRTTWFARVDHILFKGLEPPLTDAAGTPEDIADASDHRPVWARARPGS